MKGKYQLDDMVTFYFVIYTNPQNGSKDIQAYSDDHALVKYYMEFHNCSHFHMKKMTSTYHDIIKIIEENRHDDIQIVNISTNDSDHKGKVKMISVPMTETEYGLLTGEINSMMGGCINYHIISEFIYYLKPKYQKALKHISLIDILNWVLYSANQDKIQKMSLDELHLFIHAFPQFFGK